MSNPNDFVIENGVLKKYVGPGGDVTIPEGVTEIWGIYCNSAFWGCESITSITFPDGIEVIGKNAFYYCTDLKNAVLPASVRKIDTLAFTGCKLELLTILGNPEISQYAFGQTQKESELQAPALWIPNMELKNIPKQYVRAACEGFVLAYYDSNPAVEVRKAEYLKTLKTQRKKYYASLASNEKWLSLFLSEKLLSKKEAADVFELGKEKMPVHIKAMLMDYSHAEEKVPAQDLTLESTEKKIPTAELKKMWSWKELEDGTICITSYKGTSEEVAIPDTVAGKEITVIGEYALSPKKARIQNQFARENIRRITIPDSVRTIQGGAFSGCKLIREIVLPEKLERIEGSFPDGRAFSSTGLISINIPNSVTQLGCDSFSDCRDLKIVSLSNQLSIIERSTFYRCEALEEIVIPESVTEIGFFAFCGCTSLRSVHLSANIRKIDQDAFGRASDWIHPICPNLTIYAPTGSYAEQYAKENNIPFAAE